MASVGEGPSPAKKLKNNSNGEEFRFVSNLFIYVLLFYRT